MSYITVLKPNLKNLQTCGKLIGGQQNIYKFLKITF